MYWVTKVGAKDSNDYPNPVGIQFRPRQSFSEFGFEVSDTAEPTRFTRHEDAVKFGRLVREMLLHHESAEFVSVRGIEGQVVDEGEVELDVEDRYDDDDDRVKVYPSERRVLTPDEAKEEAKKPDLGSFSVSLDMKQAGF